MTALDEYSITFAVRWADLDPNGHVRNSAYLDYSVDVRMNYFDQTLFREGNFAEDNIGPVLQREEIIYKREIRASNAVRVDLRLAGVSEDGSRFKMITNIYSGESLAAIVTVEGGWLDLKNRKLRLPTQEILEALDRMPRIDEVEKLRNLKRE